MFLAYNCQSMVSVNSHKLTSINHTLVLGKLRKSPLESKFIIQVTYLIEKTRKSDIF